jgi:hypothetical protein
MVLPGLARLPNASTEEEAGNRSALDLSSVAQIKAGIHARTTSA